MKIKDLFKKKVYTIRFSKVARNVSELGTRWTEISDSSLLNTLISLQDHFNFDILKTDMANYCEIKIRCNKSDIFKIINQYLIIFDGYIENIKF